MEVKLRNKLLYKVEIELLRILPMLLALVYILNTILSYFDIEVPALSYIGGVSIIPLIFIYVSSYVFKFCVYHRMFLHYIVVANIINIYDAYLGIPLTDRELFSIHLTIIGVFLFIILYLYVKSHKRPVTESNK